MYTPHNRVGYPWTELRKNEPSLYIRLLGLYTWETNLIETLTNIFIFMPIDEIVSCSATVTDEFELQLTKIGDKA